MMKRIVGALVGREMAQRRGGSGVGGAAMGWAAMGVLRRMGPLGTVLGGAYVAKKVLGRRRNKPRI